MTKIPDDAWGDDIVPPGPEPGSDAAEETAAWAKTSNARRPSEPPRTSSKAMAKAAEASRMMRESRDWSEAKPSHLVALYAWCHERIYGVPSELARDGQAFARATLLASRMLRLDFGGEVSEMVGFIRWAWAREQGREKWRRDNGMPGSRMGWRLQFAPGGALVTDWRLARARAMKPT